MAKTRTFIAVEAADGVHAQAQAAVIERLRPLASNVKWVEPENLHWTLQFLGDLKDEEIAEVCRRHSEGGGPCGAVLDRRVWRGCISQA